MLYLFFIKKKVLIFNRNINLLFKLSTINSKNKHIQYEKSIKQKSLISTNN